MNGSEGKNGLWDWEGESGFRLREEAWALPLLVLASLEATIFVAFQAFLLYQVLLGGLRRTRLYLDQALLVGSFFMPSVAILYASQMNPVFCLVTRLGTGLSYSLVFGTLLVKSVVLLSLHRRGSTLSPTYQALLLLFVLMPQVSSFP